VCECVCVWGGGGARSVRIIIYNNPSINAMFISGLGSTELEPPHVSERYGLCNGHFVPNKITEPINRMFHAAYACDIKHFISSLLLFVMYIMF
jgi:hypothetical protein